MKAHNSLLVMEDIPLAQEAQMTVGNVCRKGKGYHEKIAIRGTERAVISQLLGKLRCLHLTAEKDLFPSGSSFKATQNGTIAKVKLHIDWGVFA